MAIDGHFIVERHRLDNLIPGYYNIYPKWEYGFELWHLSFVVLMLILGLWFKQSLEKRTQTIFKASLLECLITWPLVLWWEPQNPKFWLLTLIPLILCLALSFEAMEISLRAQWSRWSKTTHHALMALPPIVELPLLTVNASISAGDLIPHLRYWGGRPNTVYRYRSLQASQDSPDDFHDLRAQFDQALCAHHAVLITPASVDYASDSQLSLVGVSREDLRSFLEENAHRGKVDFWYRDVFGGKLLPVYKLNQTPDCPGQ